MRCCHQQSADHLDGCRSANFGHSLWGVAGLERPRRLIKDRATTPERGRVALPGVPTDRTARRTRFQKAFWHTWTREAYLGCCSDLSDLSDRVWE